MVVLLRIRSFQAEVFPLAQAAWSTTEAQRESYQLEAWFLLLMPVLRGFAADPVEVVPVLPGVD